MRKVSIILFLSLALISTGLNSSKTHAAEAGVSFYVPGLYGDIAVAIPPSPGNYMLSTSIHYRSMTLSPLLPNQVDEKIKAETFAELVRGFWVSNETILGAKVLMGFRAIALDVNVEADINTPIGPLQIKDRNSGFGDLAVIPLSLYWQFGDLYINLYEVISIPVGQFDKNRFANIALNHWSFDTVLGITWLDQKTGIELSLTPGLIYNTVNKDTNYQTGIEFHMDVMLNWHISSSLSVGLHGSVYNQLTGDKGGHPSLGSFKGRSYSIGPSMTYYDKSSDPNFLVSLKWLHEFNSKNKAEGDLTLLTMGIKF